MSTMRVIGDVHGQLDEEGLFTRGAKPYLHTIADAACSVQIGDMGDAETYEHLMREVDPQRHRFFPGNHEHYDGLPPHCLGDFGRVQLGEVEFFFVRGASSVDKEKLIRTGKQLGKKLWHEEEELTEARMKQAEQEYLLARPRIMLTHDAPTDIARLIWQHARKTSAPIPGATFRPTRTDQFLARLWEQHQPALWAFGHYHRDWKYRDGKTLFVCVGELSFLDVDASGTIRASSFTL